MVDTAKPGRPVSPESVARVALRREALGYTYRVLTPPELTPPASRVALRGGGK